MAAGEHSSGGARTGFTLQWQEQPTKEMIRHVTDGKFDHAIRHFISKLKIANVDRGVEKTAYRQKTPHGQIQAGVIYKKVNNTSEETMRISRRF